MAVSPAATDAVRSRGSTMTTPTSPFFSASNISTRVPPCISIISSAPAVSRLAKSCSPPGPPSSFTTPRCSVNPLSLPKIDPKKTAKATGSSRIRNTVMRSRRNSIALAR